MPANEGFYRDQNTLNVVFLVSSIGLLGATIWMLADDHLKPWKRYQREFRVVKRELLTDELVQKQRTIDTAKLEDLRRRRQEAEAARRQHQDQVAAAKSQLSELAPLMAASTQAIAFLKADQAEKLSDYDLAVKQIDSAVDPARVARLTRDRDKARDDAGALQLEIDAKGLELEQLKSTEASANDRIGELGKAVSDLEDQIKKMTDDEQKIERSIKSLHYGMAEEIRAMPIIDGFASPLRVNQVALEELPLDYNFKMVTRYDRCTTCHLGIETAGLTPANGVEQPFCAHPEMDLYVSSTSPHPVEKFGCTICHQGQGTATSFDWASHTPASREQRAEWTKEYKWFFNHFHELPMLPNRFIESSCLKCHHDPYQIPQAKKLLLGYQTILTNGCYGCHEMNGYREDGVQVAMNLRIAQKADSEAVKSRAQRRVGPNLTRIAEKLDEAFVRKWIRDPRAFRPSTKMPVFYDQLDAGKDGHDSFFGIGAQGEFDNPHALADLGLTEIHAITHYLFTKSKAYLANPETPKMKDVSAAGDVARGRELFNIKGCLACHNSKAGGTAGVDLEPRNFGPDLSEIAAKFTSDEQRKWLVNWILNPNFYHPETYMPNLQLSEQDSADIASYILSVPGKWAREVVIPRVDATALYDLLISLESKGRGRKSAEEFLKGMSVDDQLLLLGEKTISRLGCFGCHDIQGFDGAKPIGTQLADWGRKDVHKLAFENVVAYVDETLAAIAPEERANHFYEKNDYYLDALHGHQREGFLMQKLREPRSYDYQKIRRWEDRARMPKFNLTDEEREAVATVILGLTGEQINRKYVYTPSPRKAAEIKGRGLLEMYNCTGCHVIQPGEYQTTPNQERIQPILALAKKQLSDDYDFPGHQAWSVPKVNDGPTVVLRGMPDGYELADTAADPENPQTFIRLWEATSLLGQVVPAGIKFPVPTSQLASAEKVPIHGGAFARWSVEYRLGKTADPNSAAERDKAWQQGPPPLLREGEKVQTPWLYRFLRDPEMIRPAAALRMPRFNYASGHVEDLANYFAAADKTPFPYIEVPERESSYLALRDAEHPNFLDDAWRLITNKDLCVKCHALPGFKPTGKPEELGPSLVRASERLRPDWMRRWISNPPRLVPYTAMPVNFVKNEPKYQELFKGTSADQVRACRDALLNYTRIVDQLLTPAAAKTVTTTKGDSAP